MTAAIKMTAPILALVLVVASQALAIAALLVHHRRRNRAERALRESEERFRLLAHSAPVMIWTATPDGSLDFLNQTCVDFTGVPLKHLLGEGWLKAVHPDDVDRCIRTYGPAFETRTPFLMEYRLRRTDGCYRWLLDTGVPKYRPDGTFAGYVGCSVDITARKDAEAEIQHLAGRLIEAQDAERARLARDLHDDVSQQLAGMSIAFSGLKQRLTESRISAELQEELRSVQQRASALAQNVRHLSHDLHPTVLRHAGLVAALSAHCRELIRTHGTPLTCQAQGDFSSITAEASLCLYRVAQEALRNVVAHAGTARADVQLFRSGDYAELTISDDGKGFDFAKSLEHGKGLGLVSIIERARLAGGTANIVAESRKGTRVSVRVPANGLMQPVSH